MDQKLSELEIGGLVDLDADQAVFMVVGSTGARRPRAQCSVCRRACPGRVHALWTARRIGLALVTLSRIRGGRRGAVGTVPAAGVHLLHRTDSGRDRMQASITK